MMIAIIAFYFFFSLLAWVRFSWALIGVIALLPTYGIRFSIGFLPLTLLEGMIVIAFVIFLLQKRADRPWSSVKGYGMPIFLFVIAATVSLFTAPLIKDGLGYWKAYIIEPLLFFFMFLSCAKKESFRKSAFFALLLSGIVISLIAIIQYFTGHGIPEPWNGMADRRAISVYEYPNAIGLAVAPILMAVLSLFIVFRFHSTSFLITLFASAIVLGFGLWTAKVDGAFFGLTAGAVFVSLFVFSRWKVIGFSIFILLIFFSIPFIRNSLLPLIFFQDVSGEVRLVLWKGTWNLLSHHPIFGAGLGGFPVLYNQFRLAQHTELLLYPHNVFLNFWVETGLLGLIAMIWIVGKFFRDGLMLVAKNRQIGRRAIVGMGCMAAILVYGLVEVPFFKNDLAVLWWIVIGNILMLKNQS